MKRGSLKDIIVIGGALFAMFFGAGNLIFPPALGLQCGSLWWLGFLFYFLADLGIGVVAIIAMGRLDGRVGRVTEPLGRIPSALISVLIIIAIGPGLAIPRTAATTYELGIVPLLGIPEAPLSRALVSAVFFALVLLLALRSGKVVDLVGKILTPLLLITLLFLIIKGAALPVGLNDAPPVSQVIRDGVFNGYQTLDMLGAIFFSVLIINSIREKGYSDGRSLSRISLSSSLVAAAMIFLVYGGLAYLGAGAGSAYYDAYHSGAINQAGLLAATIRDVLGRAGLTVQALVVSSACLTTAVGLTSSAAEFFCDLTKGRLPYKGTVAAICLISALTCNVGLSRIISISAPILMILYPLTILMVVTVFLRNKVTDVLPYRLSAAVTLIFSIFEVMGDTLGLTGIKAFIASLPLSSFGFSWLIPAALAFALGAVIGSRRKRRAVQASGRNVSTVF